MYLSLFCLFEYYCVINQTMNLTLFRKKAMFKYLIINLKISRNNAFRLLGLLSYKVQKKLQHYVYKFQKVHF